MRTSFQFLAFLLLSQSFVACQQGSVKVPTATAFVNTLSGEKAQPRTEPVRSSASDIIFQSVDNGDSWTDITAQLPDNTQMGRFFVAGNEVFMDANGGLYRSQNTPVPPVWESPVWDKVLEKEVFLGKELLNIFPGEAGPYVISYEYGLFQNIPGTDIWQSMFTELKDKNIRTLLETPNGTIFVGCDRGIFKSTDGGSNWKQVFSEGMVTSFVAKDDVLIAGGFRGVLLSTDGGEHWDWTLNGQGAAISTRSMPGGLVAMATDGKNNFLWASTDNGKNWQRIDKNLPVGSISDIQEAGGFLFCSHETGIYRSSDQGQTWKLVRAANGRTSLDLVVWGQVIYAVMMSGC